MHHLIVCPGCARHVRADEASCPFCAELLPFSLRQRAPVLPTRRLTRAATFAFGAALAASGCGGEVPGGEDAATAEDASLVEDAFVASFDAAYGAPPFDAGPPDMADAGSDSGAVPTDGAPAPDAGPSDAGMDAGAPVAAYGGPSPIDSGA